MHPLASVGRLFPENVVHGVILLIKVFYQSTWNCFVVCVFVSVLRGHIWP
jgi:hypothetical protein